jgi:hypothetical protein
MTMTRAAVARARAISTSCFSARVSLETRMSALNREVMTLEDFLRLGVQLAVVEKAGRPCRLHAEEDVFGHGQVVGEDLFLEDHADAGLARIVRAGDAEFGAGQRMEPESRV